MTAKSAFTEDEWKLVSEGPVTAGMIVSTAQAGGTFRETFALSKAYVEAREAHGESELLDEIVSAKPAFDRHRYHSPQELHDQGLQLLHDAVALIGQKATPEEVESYRGFVVSLAERVAGAHEEDGQKVGPAEAQALDAIRASVATDAA
jgi:hypothetical protein